MRFVDIVERRSMPIKSKQLNSGSSNRTFGFEIEFNVDIDKSQNMKDLVKSYPIQQYFEDIFKQNGEFIKELESIVKTRKLKIKGKFATKEQSLKHQENKYPEYYKKIREFKKKANNLNKLSYDEKIYFLMELDNYFNGTMAGSTKDEYDSFFKTKNNGEEFIRAEIHHILNDIKLPENAKDEIDFRYIVNKNDNLIDLLDIGYDELQKYLGRNLANEIKESIREDYYNYIKKKSESKYDIAEDIIHNELGLNTEVDIEASGKKQSSRKLWKVTGDLSLNPKEGVELISPIFSDTQNGLKYLVEILSVIEKHEMFYTDNSTGLHINIGNIDKDNIDLFKFMLFIGEQDILKEFDRQSNKHNKSLIKNLYNVLQNANENFSDDYETIIKRLNKAIYRLPLRGDKNYFLNIAPLIDEDFVEIRGMGGPNYESKRDKISSYVKKILYVLDLAESPEKGKDVYLKKIGKLITQKPEDYNITRGVSPFSVEETKELVKYMKEYTDDDMGYYEVKELVSSLSSYAETVIRIDMKYSTNKMDERFIFLLYKAYLFVDKKARQYISPENKEHEKINKMKNSITHDSLKTLVNKYILPKYNDDG